MLRKEHNETNRRKYLRLDSTFPVQFRLVSLDGKHFLSQWLMGFTNNVSKGGICLEVANLNKELLEFFKSGQVKLSVDIELPIFRRPVAATTSIAWIKEVADQPSRYCIGLHYDVIDSLQNAQIMRYAWMKKLFVPVTFGIIAFCIAAFAFNFLVNNRLAASNKLLVRQLVKTLNETDIVKRKASDIAQEKDALQSKLAYLEKQIVVAEKERQGKRGDSAPAAAHGSLGPLGVLQQEKKILQDKLAFVQQQEAVVASEMRRLGKRKSALEKANFDKMLVWLKTHQNPRTGLVVSFEGDNDLSRWAFTYDQALAVIAFSRFGDLERAKKILLFYQNKAKRMDGKLLNAYYVDDGVPAEFMVHNGPNIWMAIAALHYTKRSNDTRFLGMAEQIAQSVMKMQEQDKDGGIRGGPNVPWYATEHNLDAFALFKMLHEVTKKHAYETASNVALQWLIKHTYAQEAVPIQRGKGDSTIATDTYAWTIAAIGPAKLQEMQMNPDQIMEFAEQNCSVEASFLRPEGWIVKIKGFDFAPQRHVARGGIVSSEWTAQMVLAFKIMADYYRLEKDFAKADVYDEKAEVYLNELTHMLISSPSPSGQGEGCLPYATQDNVDTGHGWMTPKGQSTGSVAGTAYALFAYYNFNPLALKD